MSEDRFKFRAWHKHFLSMERVKMFNEETVTIENEHSQIAWFRDEMILMQATGLRDKNGTPIFEADILQGTDSLGKPCTAIVEWDRFGFAPWTWFEPGTYIDNIEILGNLHENPELLKAQDDK